MLKNKQKLGRSIFLLTSVTLLLVVTIMACFTAKGYTLANTEKTMCAVSSYTDGREMPIKTSEDGIMPLLYGEVTESWLYSCVNIDVTIDPKDNWGIKDDYVRLIFTADSSEIYFEYKIIYYDDGRVVKVHTDTKKGPSIDEKIYYADKSVNRLFITYAFIVDGEKCIDIEHTFNKF